VEGDYAFGTAVNHDPAPGLVPFLGTAKDAQVGLTFRPTPRIRLGETYLVSRLESQAASIFTERRLRTKFTYQLTRQLSVRTIVDNKIVTVNRALADGDDERKWSGDVLLTYLVNPGTALYIGYIDQFENIDILPGSPPNLRRIGRPSTSVARQVFAKVSYLLRF
jgi:predicted porin